MGGCQLTAGGSPQFPAPTTLGPSCKFKTQRGAAQCPTVLVLLFPSLNSPLRLVLSRLGHRQPPPQCPLEPFLPNHHHHRHAKPTRPRVPVDLPSSVSRVFATPYLSLQTSLCSSPPSLDTSLSLAIALCPSSACPSWPRRTCQQHQLPRGRTGRSGDLASCLPPREEDTLLFLLLLSRVLSSASGLRFYRARSRNSHTGLGLCLSPDVSHF